MPLGIEEDSSWERRTITFNPGDKLILYTDGVTEAQNDDGDIFDEQLLIECILRQPEISAFKLQDAIMQDIKDFVAGAPQFDDITLMILEKEHNSAQD